MRVTPPRPLLYFTMALLCAVVLHVAVLFAEGGSEFGGSEREGKPHIAGLDLAIEDRQVLLSFLVVGLFDEAFMRRIDSGLATEIRFDLRLVKLRRWWFDRNAEEGNLQVTATYNAVTREYQVHTKYNGNLIDSSVVRDAEELEEAMTRFIRIPAFSLRGRGPGRLMVQVRAELGPGTRLFFIPTTRTTDWVERRFQIGQDGQIRLGPELRAPSSAEPGGADPARKPKPGVNAEPGDAPARLASRTR